MDAYSNKIVSEEASKNILISEESKAMLVNEKSSKNENEVMVVKKDILVNKESECNKINVSGLLGMDKENSVNDCHIVDANIQNIQSTTNENDQAAVCLISTTTVCKNISEIEQRTLQKSTEIIQCKISNNTNNNIVQNENTNHQELTKLNNNNENNLFSQIEESGNRTSLNIIAVEYESSNSDIEEIEADVNKIENQDTMQIVQAQNLQQYRTVIEKVLSSSNETDSEDDSSSSSSSSDSSTSSSSSDSNNITTSNNNKKNGNKTNITNKQNKQEQLDALNDLPPIEDLQINVPETLCDSFGEVADMVEQLVIVKPKPGKPTLHLDTVLFVNRGQKTLGKIFDVFGTVSEPNYCIRFNSSEHIQKSDIKMGMPVYYCPNTPYTSFIFLHEMTNMKYYDADGDEETPEFSDDEEEQAYYEKLKQKNRKDSSEDSTSRKRRRTSSPTQNRQRNGWRTNHPWNRNFQSQGCNQERQQARRNSNNFNATHNELYTHNDFWPQYPYHSNMCWPPLPPNAQPMPNRPYTGYEPRIPLNRPSTSQFNNHNSNNSGNANQYFQGAEQNFQGNNISRPRIPYDIPLRFNPAFPAFPMNRPQSLNASFPYMGMSYPPYARPPIPPIRMNAPWQSLPISQPSPSPPLTNTITIDKK